MTDIIHSMLVLWLCLPQYTYGCQQKRNNQKTKSLHVSLKSNSTPSPRKDHYTYIYKKKDGLSIITSSALGSLEINLWKKC